MTGITKTLVGSPTTNPIRKPPPNLMGKPGSSPVIKAVIVKVIVKSIASVMNIASNNVEYFLFIFTALTYEAAKPTFVHADLALDYKCLPSFKAKL
jgi:hypothetical protein